MLFLCFFTQTFFSTRRCRGFYRKRPPNSPWSIRREHTYGSRGLRAFCSASGRTLLRATGCTFSGRFLPPDLTGSCWSPPPPPHLPPRKVGGRPGLAVPGAGGAGGGPPSAGWGSPLRGQAGTRAAAPRAKRAPE